MSSHTRNSLDLVQKHLLEELARVLSGTVSHDHALPSFNSQPRGRITTYSANGKGSRPAASASDVMLALHTLEIFEFRDMDLFAFVTDHVMPYVDDPRKDIRCVAVRVACKLLLPMDPSSPHQVSFQQEYSQVQKLISVGLSDREYSVRSSLLNALDERFDPYLIQSENVSFLLMALHDEKYEIQRAVLNIISRLSSSIPGVVTNAVRQLILDLLRALEYSQETSTIIESVKLLGLSIHSTSSLIEAYVNPVFELLVNHLKTIQQGVCMIDSLSLDRIKIAFIDTLSLLAEVGSPELAKHNDVLMPIVIDALKQNNELREAGLGLLEAYSYCTGYVIDPYLQYSSLLDILLNQHNRSGNGSYTLNERVMRCIGVLGAIDPFIYKKNMYQRVHEITRRKRLSESDDQLVSYDDLQEDQHPLLCRYQERNLSVEERVVLTIRLLWKR